MWEIESCRKSSSFATMGTNLSSQEELTRYLEKKKAIRTARVKNVMAKLDYKDFCKSGSPYADSPKSIGHGATISAPHMHAYALELLKNHLKSDSKVLDVGSGSGFLTACFALMLGDGGQAVGIDHIDDLVQQSKVNVKKAGMGNLLASGRLKFVVGDGRQGYASGGPYNAMHVGAAAKDLPKPLLKQLAPGGRLIIPVGENDWYQYFEQVDKDDQGRVSRERLLEVRFVPLTDKQVQEATKRSRTIFSSR